MIDIVSAALGPGPGKVLLVGASPRLAAGLKGWVGTVIVLHSGPRRGGRRFGNGSWREAPGFVHLRAEADAMPFVPASFDAVACLGGLPGDLAVERLRGLVRPGGTVLVASQVRNGVAGGAASLVRRAARSAALPRASDLTAAMLMAGLRPVRQAAAAGGVVPTVVTWALVRPRPWDEPSPGGPEP